MPGTDNEVISIVIERRKNIVPASEHIRLNMIILYLWNINTINIMNANTRPMISVAKNAHGISGTLSKINKYFELLLG